VVAEEIAGVLQRTYQYDSFGRRLTQIKKDTDGGGPVVAEDSYYGYNPHTDVETLTKDSGDTRATYGYTAYGKDDEQSFTGVDKPEAQQPGKQPYNFYRYNGKRFDVASGSYDMGFRDYNPGLNRFLTRDSYNGALADMHLGADAFTGNRYAFTSGNPISRIEADGHRPEDEPGYCLGYQGDCGIDSSAGNEIRGQYSPDQLEGMGVLDSQQPQFGGYRLPTGEYDYGLLTEQAGKVIGGLPDPRDELDTLWQSVFAIEAACEDLYKQGGCSLEFLHSVEADRYAITQAAVRRSDGLSGYDFLEAGIEAAAAAGFGVGSNRVGGVGRSSPALTRVQADDIAKYLGYTKTKQVSAGKTAIWENKKAGGGQPRYITFDRTGHNKDAVFKGANFRNPFQSTKDSARDGTYGLDIGPNGELRGLEWLAK
jgi:RHS repeat-associated protein